MIPKIKIEYDLDKETGIFYNFLHSSKFPQQGKQIFRAFPALEEALSGKDKTEGEERSIIKDFIEKFRADHRSEIAEAMEINGSLLATKGERALGKLAELMNYEWSPDHKGYIAIPTILPFSPFGKDIFYFSIFNKDRNVVIVAIHEISHMLFFEMMDKIYGKSAEKVIGWTGAHFLKEILAPVLMNQGALKNILESQDSYGNPFLKHIYISANNEIAQITKFFQNIYEHCKNEKKLSFSEILKIMVKIISSIEEEIKIKNELWNQYGSKIAQNEEKFNLYKEPIKIELEI